jgi:hypothetical protein
MVVPKPSANIPVARFCDIADVRRGGLTAAILF